MEKDPIYSEKPSETTIDAVEFLSNINTKKLGKKALTIVLSSAILVSSLFMGGCSEKSVSASDGESELDADYQTRYTVEDIYDGDIETPEYWFVDNSINYYDGTENVAEGFNFDKLTPEQQSEIKMYEAMDIEEFNALPQNEQLKYSYWLLENNKPHFDLIIKFNESDLKYSFNPKTAQDLANNLLYIKRLMTTISTIKNNENNEFDIENASKLVSLGYYDNDANEEKVQGTLSVLGSSSLMPSSIEAKTYQLSNDGSIYINCIEGLYNETFEAQYRFYPVTFTDIHENENTVWLVKEGNHSGSELYNPNVTNTDVTTPIINQ